MPKKNWIQHFYKENGIIAYNNVLIEVQDLRIKEKEKRYRLWILKQGFIFTV